MAGAAHDYKKQIATKRLPTKPPANADCKPRRKQHRIRIYGLFRSRPPPTPMMVGTAHDLQNKLQRSVSPHNRKPKWIASPAVGSTESEAMICSGHGRHQSRLWLALLTA
jgi:hypothetical protein